MPRASLPLLALTLLVGGCASGGKTPESGAVTSAKPAVGSNAPAEAPKMAPVIAKARATDRKANHDGVVFVGEWHRVEEGKNAMIRPPALFRRDLERLYKAGFRPVTANEYIENKMDLPPGASPVVMTFDDAHSTQIRLKDDGTLDPTCAMGIWADFAKTHPDFPIHATFFVLPDTMWGQPKFRQRKLDMVKAWGSEIANHTITHPSLRKLTDAQVRGEISGASAKLREYGHTGPISLALPMGISPKNRAILADSGLSGVFLVGANPAPAPGPKLQRVLTKIPRIQAYDGELSLDEWLGQVEKGRVKPYVE